MLGADKWGLRSQCLCQPISLIMVCTVFPPFCSLSLLNQAISLFSPVQWHTYLWGFPVFLFIFFLITFLDITLSGTSEEMLLLLESVITSHPWSLTNMLNLFPSSSCCLEFIWLKTRWLDCVQILSYGCSSASHLVRMHNICFINENHGI